MIVHVLLVEVEICELKVVPKVLEADEKDLRLFLAQMQIDMEFHAQPYFINDFQSI